MGSSFLRMRRNVASGAFGLCLAMAGAVGAAQAQSFFGPGPSSLPPEDIHRIVAAQGYRLIVPPFRNGDVYVADVVDAHGMQERLMVDAYRGTIVQRFRAVRVQPRYEARRDLPWPGEDNPVEPDSSASTGFRFPWDEAPVPPRPIPGPRDTGVERWPGTDAERTARAPGDDTEPRVIPGVGPEAVRPRVRHQAKPKAPDSQVVRATPLPPPDKTVAPAAAPQQATPAPAAAPQTAEPAASPPPAAKPAPPAASAPPPAAKPPAAVATTSAPPPVVKKPKPLAQTPASSKAPLNDIPPAPLD